MKKLFTLLVANMLIVGGVFAQDSESRKEYSEHAGTNGSAQTMRVSSNGKYLAGQESYASGIMFLWNTETDEYTTINLGGEGQLWSVSDGGMAIGCALHQPVIIKLGDITPTVLADTSGQAFGCNQDESIIVGTIEDYDGIQITPVLWRLNGDKYEIEYLDYPKDNIEYFEFGAFARGISDDGAVIWGQAQNGPRDLIVWKLVDGEYVLENVTENLKKDYSDLNGLEPDHISPNGKYITGIAYKTNGAFSFRYDTELNELEVFPLPAGIQFADGHGRGVANDGTIVCAIEDLSSRKPYIIRGGSSDMISFEEWLSYSNVDIPEQLSAASGVTLSGISGDAKTIGGYYQSATGEFAFYLYIPDLQLGVDEVTDNTVRDDEFCYVEDGQLYIPGGCDALYVYSIGGVQVFAAADGTATSYSLQSLPNGVYVVRAEKEGQNIVTKIIL